MKTVVKKHKKEIFAAVLGVVVLGSIAAGVIIKSTGSKNGEITYREVAAVCGDLTVGITESGTVDIGIVEQTFDLDISELVRVSLSSGGNSAGMMGNSGQGGMDMFSQIFNFAGQSGQSVSGKENSIEITQVNVSVGEQVEIGDVLYVLDSEKVEELRERLQSDVEKALADLELVYAQQEESRQSAEHTLETALVYGEYALTEYNQKIASLTDTVNEKQSAVDIAKEELELYKKRLTDAQADYEVAKSLLENATWSAEHTDKLNSTYLYVEYVELQTQAQSNVSTLENQISQLEQSIEKAESQLETSETELAKAKRSLESGKLTAKQTYDLRILAYENAQETYDIAISYLDENAVEQEETYGEAKERWEEFETHIDGNNVCADYSGVVTEVSFAVGDSMSTDDVLIRLYNLEDVAMTVTVSEEDMTDIALGTWANVVFTAYPNQVFAAVVSEIGEAVSSGSEVTYEVTVSLQGDVGGLYQSMTGDITFITKESKEVLYVPNRSIIRKGNKSYVKVKENNSVKTVEVVTGFSDGVNVEIKEGLSDGDVVLIESKVEG